MGNIILELDIMMVNGICRFMNLLNVSALRT